MNIATLRSHRPNAHLVLRIAFLALVALNMTIVCQGHTEGNLRVGAHLIVLKDPPFVGQGDTSAAPQPQQTLTSQSSILAMVARLPSAYSSDQQRIQSLGNKRSCTVQPLTAPLTTGPANLLGMASLLAVPSGVRFAPVSPASASTWSSQTTLGPDAPPPRILLPVPA